jgi:hypothetical protein
LSTSVRDERSHNKGVRDCSNIDFPRPPMTSN